MIKDGIFWDDKSGSMMSKKIWWPRVKKCNFKEEMDHLLHIFKLSFQINITFNIDKSNAKL